MGRTVVKLWRSRGAERTGHAWQILNEPSSGVLQQADTQEIGTYGLANLETDATGPGKKITKRPIRCIECWLCSRPSSAGTEIRELSQVVIHLRNAVSPNGHLSWILEPERDGQCRIDVRSEWSQVGNPG
jgi:hypothetical protein